jgi:hypothetical protein
MRRIVCATLAALLPVAAGAAVVIDHRAVSCVVAEQFTRFEAHLEPADQVSRALLYFRPTGTHDWYSVAMKGSGGDFAGVTPKPKKSLESLDYYIEVTDTTFGTARTAEHSPAVVDSASECKDKVVAGALGSASVALNVPAGASLVPTGFSEASVVAAGTPSTPAVTAGGGIGTTGLVLGGIAVAGAAVAVAAHGGGGGGGAGGGTGGANGTNTGGSSTPPQTCEAKPVTAALTGAPASLQCGQRLMVNIDVSNGSCSSLAIQAVQLHHFAPVRNGCQGVDATYSYTPTVRTLAAGQAGTVLAFASDAFCCVNGPCRTTVSCPFQETFVVKTGAGDLSAGSAQFSVSYSPSCPTCAASPTP